MSTCQRQNVSINEHSFNFHQTSQEYSHFITALKYLAVPSVSRHRSAGGPRSGDVLSRLLLTTALLPLWKMSVKGNTTNQGLPFVYLFVNSA